MLCGLPAIITYSLIAEGNPMNFHWSWKALICIAYLAIFGSVAAFWMYYWLLHRVESTKAMMISLVTPLLAVVIMLVWRDDFRLALLASSFLALVAAAFAWKLPEREAA